MKIFPLASLKLPAGPFLLQSWHSAFPDHRIKIYWPDTEAI